MFAAVTGKAINHAQDQEGFPVIVRFGYVAMSSRVKNASPSKTMTWAHFRQLGDREAGLHKLEHSRRKTCTIRCGCSNTTN